MDFTKLVNKMIEVRKCKTALVFRIQRTLDLSKYSLLLLNLSCLHRLLSALIAVSNYNRTSIPLSSLIHKKNIED